MFQKYLCTSWFFIEELVQACNFTKPELFHRKFSNIRVSNTLRNLNTVSAELFHENVKQKWLDVFLWLTVKSYREVSESSHRRCSIRAPFLQNTPGWLLLNFHKKVLTNVRNVRERKAQKRFTYGEKKKSMKLRETNSKASYSNWRPSSD